jgi:plasmid stabilization system protein ParE
VAQIVYSARAIENLERTFEFLLAQNPPTALADAETIETAVDTLAAHPLIGRRVEGDLRELVISFGVTGHIALYRFVVQEDTVRVLALRHQREIGYLP